MPTREQQYLKHYEEYKQTRSIRKQVKRNRQPDGVRRREWLPGDTDDPEAFYDLDVPDSERVMPKGERERRKANLSAILVQPETEDAEEGAALAYDTPATTSTHLGEGQGVVVEVSSGLCRVSLGERTLLCSLRGALSAYDSGFTNVVAVGDEVIVTADGSDGGVVEAVLPRRSALARPDVFRSHLQQIIAANVEQLLIVASWREPAFWPELVDRYLITAARNRLNPIICVNKTDLAGGRSEYEKTLRPYQILGYRIVFASAHTMQGIDELRRLLHGRSTVLAGLSGVGKSSLLAAVQPGLELRTHEVSDRRHEGQHTTTQVTLLKLEGDGSVVDTPGIREFGLSGLKRSELAAFYPEMGLLAPHCRFDDCSHTREPGCAVRAAAQHGWIAAMRYDSYQKILASL